MAKVRERIDSRSGHTLGIEGLVGKNRIFDVYLDDVDQDVELVIQDPVLVTDGDPVPYASPWPGANPFGLVATGITALRRITKTHYRVRVTYTPPLLAINVPGNTIDRWEWTINGGLQFEKLLFDNQGKPIASPYYTVDRPEGLTDAEWAAQETFFTFDDQGKLIEVRRVGGRYLSPEGRDMPVPVTLLRGFRKVARLPMGANGVGAVLSHRGRVNVREFMGAPPGHLRFKELVVHPRSGQLIIGGSVQGPGDIKHFDVSVEFEWLPFPWDPWVRVNVIKLDDGSVVPVFPSKDADGNPITEDQLRSNDIQPVVTENFTHSQADFIPEILAPFD